jgi:hypothetical protein
MVEAKNPLRPNRSALGIAMRIVIGWLADRAGQGRLKGVAVLIAAGVPQDVAVVVQAT